MLRALLLLGLAGRAAAGPDDTARLLASRATSEAAWTRFQQPNLEHMRAWWKGRGPAAYKTVFYPFSGPDIANALAFFPDADAYLMFGLEAPGELPDVAAMDDDAIAAGLAELEASLHDILQVNYFFTKAMAKKLGRRSFNSISGLLLFFLAKSDCEVISAQPIAVGRAPGVEIAFRRRGGKPQTLRYVQVNVADGEPAKRDFFAYVARQGRLVTMLKSASYLMHEEGTAAPVQFTQIRALILAQSDWIVQDDSGVPLRLFARDAWRLSFHGAYAAPTPEFSRYLQRPLQIEMQRFSSGKLPFSYGYAYRDGESNLLIAERIP